MNFKVGDYVICIIGTGRYGGLIEGQIYKIAKIEHNAAGTFFCVNQNTTKFYHTRFKLYRRENLKILNRKLLK